jgi:hypothetical protein
MAVAHALDAINKYTRNTGFDVLSPYSRDPKKGKEE